MTDNEITVATRDYIKRGKGKSTKRGRQTPNTQQGFPIKWALIAILLVGGLGYGLYFLSSNPAPTAIESVKPTQSAPANTPSVEKKTPVASTKPTTTAKPLPPKPEEEWQYKELLENRTIEVEKREPTAPSRPYLMQCGAYRSESQAEERKVMIAFQGLTSAVRVSEGEKGKWYRVVLGPYDRKREAERDKNQLARAGIEPCAIWYWD